MGGELGEKLEAIVANYNASQGDFVVVPTYKGTYPETMTAAIAAFRAGEQPAIVQVFEVGTGTMMAAQGAVYPVHQLMADMNEPFDPAGFLPSVVGYYTDTQGNMLSMPFNSSTPIMYYNKDVFEAAGLDPEQPPAPGRSLSRPRARSWSRARRPAASPPPGSAGSTPRTCRPGTTSPSARSGTASAARRPSFRSTTR
jgi:sn-glycerol 3-phosphate transport system substrate-binding protein